VRRARLGWLLLSAAAAALLVMLPSAEREDGRNPSGLAALLLFARPMVADLMLGDFFVRSSENDFSALDRARRILELRPEDDEVRELVASRLAFDIDLRDALRAKLWVQEAAALFREGLVLQPDSAALHFWLGVLYLGKGEALRAPGIDVELLAATELVRSVELASRPAYLDPAVLATTALAASHAPDAGLAQAADFARRIMASPSFHELEQTARDHAEGASRLASLRDHLDVILDRAH
jgi:hypothetical protein